MKEKALSWKKGDLAAYSSLFLIVLFVGIGSYSPVQAVECGGESDHECYVPLWQSISLNLVIALYAIAMAVSGFEWVRGRLNKFSSASLFVSCMFLAVFVGMLVWLSMQSGH